jgi:4-amino-4-deoxy-L-arabinose transferase-like glycosyltransferase
LFPGALRLCFFLGGDQPQAAILPGLLYGLAGILLLGSIARRVIGATYAAVLIVVLTGYPYLVSYEHIPLTEMGTFFFLVLLLWSLLGVARRPAALRLNYSVPFTTALVLALGFYHRPTIIYFAPFAAVLYLCLIVLIGPPGHDRVRPTELWRLLKDQARPVALRVLIIVIVPWILCYPWTRLADRRIAETRNRVLGGGMALQAVIPPEDPRLGTLAVPYGQAVREATIGGRLRTEGLRLGTYYDTVASVAELVNQVGPGRIVIDYPLRYLRGYVRTLIVYMGYPRFPVESENEPYSIGVFTQWPATYPLDRALGWRDVPAFAPPLYGGGAALGVTMHRLSSFYTWLVLCSTFGSLLWFITSIYERNPVAMAIAGVPLGYLVLHAVTLVSINRYAFPTYPLFIACAICAMHRLGQFLTRNFRRFRADYEARTLRALLKKPMAG